MIELFHATSYVRGCICADKFDNNSCVRKVFFRRKGETVDESERLFCTGSVTV